MDGGGVDVTSILPAANVPMFRYRGSLTTPPCTENIIWSVYASPQVISVDQVGHVSVDTMIAMACIGTAVSLWRERLTAGD